MLARWDPFREIMSIRNTMDRLFDSVLSGTTLTWQPTVWDLALDVAEDEDEYVVKASIPGINPDDLEITFSNNTLTIKGEVKEDKELEQAHYHLRERRYGSFARSVTLPAGIEADKIEATYEAGVLKLRLPKAEEVRPKKIAINSGEKPKVIEAKASEVVSKN